VLLVVSALLALDALIAWVGARQGWTRPVAWLGPLLGIFGSLLFSVALLPSFGAGSRGTAEQYRQLAAAMAEIGHPLDGSSGPVITNFPIWMAETQRIDALALPDEPPRDVLDLASTFGAKLVVLMDADSTHWPHDLDSGVDGSACFHELDLGAAPSRSPGDTLAGVRAFEVVCS
jgi:hypothetical protein